MFFEYDSRFENTDITADSEILTNQAYTMCKEKSQILN